MKNENRNLNEAGKEIQKRKDEWKHFLRILANTTDKDDRDWLAKKVTQLINEVASIEKAANEAGFAMYQQALKQTA